MDPQIPQTPQTITAAAPTGLKILCIEDEHFISELYVRALTKAGYDVTVEVDGQRGLELAQTNKFDVILLDLMIPTITGIDVLRHLRNPKETPNLKAKIIITTNLEQRDDIRADIESQADGYVVKAEITPHELVDMLQSLSL